MKTKDFAKLGKQLLPVMPGFVMKKNMIFKSPVNDFLYGVFFQSSVDVDWFYLSDFILPLFVPSDSVHGTFGKRIGHDINWNADNPNLMVDLNAAILDDAMPFLDRVIPLAGMVDYLKVNVNRDRPRVNSHVLEAYAYTLIKSGDYASARNSLAEQVQMLEGDTIPWVVEQRKRALLIEEKLEQHPEIALAQLDVWKTETVRHLGLEKYLQ